MNTSDERKAERTLLRQTLDLSPEDLEAFLQRFGIPREEYNQLLVKYKHLIAGYNKLSPKEKQND